MKTGNFVLEFIKHPKQLGTFTQSSPSLVYSVVSEMNGKNIVELGAGSGPVTRGILNKLGPDGKLTTFEINHNLYQNLLNIKDPRLTVINDSAENLSKYVCEVDCVISGIPLTSIKQEERNKILDSCSKYPLFIQYKYMDSAKDLRKYFSNIYIKREWRNVPPAVIYICDNKDFY